MRHTRSLAIDLGIANIPRDVQRSIIHPRTGRRWGIWLVLVCRTQATEYTFDRDGIGEDVCPSSLGAFANSNRKGFILGEGFLSILSLLMESLGVPHY